MTEELNDACATIVNEIKNGDRHVIDDAESYEVIDNQYIEFTHTNQENTVILRYSLYYGQHNSGGSMSEFDPYDIRVA